MVAKRPGHGKPRRGFPIISACPSELQSEKQAAMLETRLKKRSADRVRIFGEMFAILIQILADTIRDINSKPI
jgi:hypothetical protein